MLRLYKNFRRMSDRRVFAVLGGGPAGLIAADHLAALGEVHLYERNRTVGRKFLVAGEGGLNITNSAPIDRVIEAYLPQGPMGSRLESFGPEALRSWLSERGIPTFIGSSGRVFPERGIKPAEVLRSIREGLVRKGVEFHTEHTFIGFDPDQRPIVEHAGEQRTIVADRYMFALGGASWAKTGSTGEWAKAFEAIGVSVAPFAASNCGVEVALPDTLRVHVGKPLKNIRVTCGDRSVRGEATLTEHGLEGNAIYPMVPAVREALAKDRQAVLELDLKPDLSEEELVRRLSGAAWKERMAAAKLDRVQVALLKAFTPVMQFVDGSSLVQDIKHLRIPVHGLRPIEEAISTVGGIAWSEVEEDLSLKLHPHLFVAGEMLDWDAPTGGYLLQGCFSTGVRAAQGMLD